MFLTIILMKQRHFFASPAKAGPIFPTTPVARNAGRKTPAPHPAAALAPRHESWRSREPAHPALPGNAPRNHPQKNAVAIPATPLFWIPQKPGSASSLSFKVLIITLRKLYNSRKSLMVSGSLFWRRNLLQALAAQRASLASLHRLTL